MKTEHNILLPTASVHLFLKDSETRDAAHKLSDDWRFARVNVSVEEGDVETAILNYKDSPSPNLVIIETDKTDESFTAQLERLSEYCNEGTSAIIIGPVNDVNLYRALTSMGVSDYLVKPVLFEPLSGIIAENLIDKLGAKGSRLIGVIGAKGGVGTSAITQALAWGVSENLEQKTFLMDAAGGWSSLSVGMGFEPSTSLYEASKAASSKDEDNLARMFFKANEKLDVLATGSEPMLDTSINAQQYEDLINLMMEKYPIVIVDLSGAIPSLKRMVINRCHELIVITTPTLPALRGARSLMQEVKLLQGGASEGYDLVVNMQGLALSKEVPKKDIEDSLDHKPNVIIPFDPKLFITAENEGQKLSKNKAGADIVKSLLPLAQKVIGNNKDALKENSDNAGASGLLNKILGKG